MLPQPLPLGITPHKLRHTFASILVAIGKDPTYAMQQLGHTDQAFTLRIYAMRCAAARTSASSSRRSSEATIGHRLGTDGAQNGRIDVREGRGATPTETQKAPRY